MSTLTKKDIIQSLEKIATYLEIKGENTFKVSAYRKAANSLEKDERSIHEIEKVIDLPNIGKGTASVIEELRATGESTLLHELTEELPAGLLQLLKLPSLGGKKVGKLYQELNIVNIERLKEACEQKKVQQLAGFGAKTEEKLLSAIHSFNERPERLAIDSVLPVVDMLKSRLNDWDSIERFELAGSFRRGRETVKDLDFIISTKEPNEVRKLITSMDKVSNIISQGDTKVSIEIDYDHTIVPVDFRLVEDQAFFTTLHHFTGSKDHNILMRQRAKENGEKISEYGVENGETGEVKTFQSERDFFQHFNLHFIPPEVREGRKELEIYESRHELVQEDMIRGDLHMHTTWSDGANSIEEMVQACKELGYEYIAMTDHSQFLKVANGLTVDRLQKQHEKIRKLNEKEADFTILTGIEMDILPNGSLDFDNSILKKIDFVIASIHSSFQQDEEMIMQRLRTALENPYVDMIAHPTGRLIGRRDGYAVNMEELIRMAADTNTILELNANPQRLDLSAKWLQLAQKEGAKIAINTDAHDTRWLNDMKIGVKMGRRGWLEAKTVVNTWSIHELKEYIK